MLNGKDEGKRMRMTSYLPGTTWLEDKEIVIFKTQGKKKSEAKRKRGKKLKHVVIYSFLKR